MSSAGAPGCEEGDDLAWAVAPRPADQAPELDLTSPLLDAQAALACIDLARVYVPVDVRPMDNLYKARYLLPVEDEAHLRAKRGPLSAAAMTTASLSSSTTTAEPPAAKKRRADASFNNPLNEIASSFVSGPLSMLRRCMNQPVTVTVRRAQGQRATMQGILGGFDRHFNVLLLRAAEAYTAVEYVLVSERERNPLELLRRFLEKHPEQSQGRTPEEILASFASEMEMWEALYRESGVLQQVARMIKDQDLTRAASVLKRRAGYHWELIMQLEAKMSGRHPPQADETADFVCLSSDKYPGRNFFYNNRTRVGQWEAPPNVQFRRVKVLKQRQRDVGTVLLRGDVVATVAARPPP